MVHATSTASTPITLEFDPKQYQGKRIWKAIDTMVTVCGEQEERD